jgi:Fe-S-cluster containining protein
MKTASIAEMLNDFSNGTYDLTDNGKCTECGSCCSNYIPLTEEEIKEIRRYIKVHNIKECKHGVAIPLAQPILDMTCPFLDDSKPNHKCTIYPARGYICSSFTCCPSKRPKIDMEWGMKAKCVNMREMFFGK